MRRRLCAAILAFEAVVLGLTTPVLISVADVGRTQALTTGLGLTLLCILTAGMLRREWAYGLGWLVQGAAIVLGLQITAMFVLGIVFLALWTAAFVLGGKIDDHKAAVEQLVEPVAAPEPVRAPQRWQHELICDADSYRPFVRERVRTLLRPPAVLFPLGCLVVGVLVAVFSEGNALLAGLFLVFTVLWPLVSWVAQRQAWRRFVADGKTYRTAFLDDRLVLETDGRLVEVPYDDITAVRTEPGLVSAGVGEEGARLELPDPVFPAAEVDRLRQRLAERPAGPSAGRPAAGGDAARP